MINISIHSAVNEDGVPIDSINTIMLFAYGVLQSDLYHILVVPNPEQAFVVWDNQTLTVDQAFSMMVSLDPIASHAPAEEVIALESAMRFTVLLDGGGVPPSGELVSQMQTMSTRIAMSNCFSEIHLYGVCLCIRYLAPDSLLNRMLKRFSNIYAMTYRFMALQNRAEVPEITFEALEHFPKAPLANAPSSCATMHVITLDANNQLGFPGGSYVLKKFLCHEVAEKGNIAEATFQNEKEAFKDLGYPFIVKCIAVATSSPIIPPGPPPKIDVLEAYTSKRVSNFQLPPLKAFLLERIDGENVRVALPGILDLRRTIVIAERMGFALHSLHSHFASEFHHGDVKLQNFVLTRVGDQVVLIDFGYFGKDPGIPLTGISDYNEHVPYGPILAQDWRADVYAFGMCLLEMMTNLEIQAVDGRSLHDRFSNGIYGFRTELRVDTEAQRVVAREVIKLAGRCICLADRLDSRPYMYQIVDRLHELGNSLV